MVSEKTSESVESTENIEDIEATEPEIDIAVFEEPAAAPVKKSRTGLFVFYALLIAVAAAYAVPQSRERIMPYTLRIWSKIKPAKPAPETAAAPENADEAVYAGVEVDIDEEEREREQIENREAFENAETIVATAEMPDEQYRILSTQILSLTEQVRGLQIENASLREMRSQLSVIEDQLHALSGKTRALDAETGKNSKAVDAMLRNKADASSVLSLSTRLTTAERKLRHSSFERERASSLLMAIYQLRDAVTHGLKFGVEQKVAYALASFDPEIAEKLKPLAALSEDGVWTDEALERMYPVYASDAMKALTENENDGWFRRAVAQIRRLVVIRRVDAPADDMAPDAVLSRAEKAVLKGDYAVALLELKRLQGRAAAAMSPWTTAADRALFARKTVNEALVGALAQLNAAKESAND